MGIKGLWQALREYVDDGHLSQFRGQRVAVDMYVWLHRCIHRSVRVNTDAVLTYFDSKYDVTGDDGSQAFLESSLPPSLVKTEPCDGASKRHHDRIPLPLIDDVLVVDDSFLTQVVDKVTALQRFGVTPVCVFDGDEMPMKGNTDEERQRRRQDAFAEAMARLEQLYCDERRRQAATSGRCVNTATTAAATMPQRPGVTLPRASRLYEEAVQLLEKAVDISTELAHTVIQVLKEERNVECIVAPYEADAQLAYLCREGYVAAAASEDSDLIAYYCPCVISKLDTFTGKCEVLQPAVCAPQFFRAVAATAAPSMASCGASHHASASRLMAGGGSHNSISGGSVHTRMRAAAVQPLLHSPSSPFTSSSEGSTEDSVRAAATTSFTYESFLLGCIMAGCDYVANLRNIGIKKAFKLVAHATSLRQVFTLLETEYGFPAEELARYRRRLLEAFYCFAHHLVYCPLRQEIVTFHPLPNNADGGPAALLKTQLVGTKWDKETAQDVCARCLCDPCTLRLYRGTYQACVTRYLQRTRRGQTSLKAYAGFEELSSNKVVVHLSSSRQGVAGVKRERADAGPAVRAEGGATADLQEDGFGAPLQKKHTAGRFLGAGGRGSEKRDAGPAEMVMVRSRYFLMRGRTAVCERWSASDDGEETEKENEGGDAEGEGKGGDGRWGDTSAVPGAVASTPNEHDVFSMHTAHLRSTTTTTTTQHPLGLSRPLRLSATASAVVPPSTDVAAKAASGSTDGSTSGAEAATAVGGVDDVHGAKERRDTSAEELRGSSGGRGLDASTATADSVECHNEDDGGQHDAESPYGSRETPTCLTETPDVEPYAYLIGDGARGTTTATGLTRANTTCSPTVRPCACPFGYWQCDRAHSVFESCFLGKQWNREEGPPPTSRPDTVEGCGAPAAVSPSSSSSSSSSSNGSTDCARAGPQGYTPRAFRPPRSTATETSPTASTVTSPSDALAAVLQTREMNQGSADTEESRKPSKDGAASPPPMPSHRAAVRMAIFDKMAFKKP